MLLSQPNEILSLIKDYIGYDFMYGKLCKQLFNRIKRMSVTNEIPILPPNLSHLDLSVHNNNNLLFNKLPNTLNYLYLDFQKQRFINIDNIIKILPPNLVELTLDAFCTLDKVLTFQPHFNNLNKLQLSFDSYIEDIVLPPNITELELFGEFKLSSLPNNLQYLHITSSKPLPQLPNSLKHINIGIQYFEKFDTLPSELETITLLKGYPHQLPSINKEFIVYSIFLKEEFFKINGVDYDKKDIITNNDPDMYLIQRRCNNHFNQDIKANNLFIYINCGVIAYFNRINNEIIVCGSNDYDNWDWRYEMCENYPDYDDEITNNMIDHFSNNPNKIDIAKFIMKNSHQYFYGDYSDEILELEDNINIPDEFMDDIREITNIDIDNNNDDDNNNYDKIKEIIFTEYNIHDCCICNDNKDIVVVDDLDEDEIDIMD